MFGNGKSRTSMRMPNLTSGINAKHLATSVLALASWCQVRLQAPLDPTGKLICCGLLQTSLADDITFSICPVFVFVSARATHDARCFRRRFYLTGEVNGQTRVLKST